MDCGGAQGRQGVMRCIVSCPLATWLHAGDRAGLQSFQLLLQQQRGRNAKDSAEEI